MERPTSPEEFRLLSLPAELRYKVYRYLLVHHEPVRLEVKYSKESSSNFADIYAYYETRLGMYPQICGTSKAVACESLAVLYGENTFHFTDDIDYHGVYTLLGLNIYSHSIKSIIVDTFRSPVSELLERMVVLPQETSWVCTEPSVQRQSPVL